MAVTSATRRTSSSSSSLTSSNDQQQEQPHQHQQNHQEHHDNHHHHHHHQQQQQQHHHHHHHHHNHSSPPACSSYVLFLAGVLVLTAVGVECSYEQTCTISTRLRGPHPQGICGDNIPQILSLLCYTGGYHGYRGKRSAEDGGDMGDVLAGSHSIKDIMLNKRDAFNYLQAREPRAAGFKRKMRGGRGRRHGYQGITCECCYNKCSISELQQYCDSD